MDEEGALCSARYEMEGLTGEIEPNKADKRNRGAVSDAAWRAYLRNCGIWSGRRALCNSRAKVLLDIPVQVFTERFKTPDGDDCVFWKTSIETESGRDEAEEEWSRDELGEFGALTEDGSFSVGNESFVGERFSVDQCIFEGNDNARVRSTFAYDWEGRLTGIVASRERRMSESALSEPPPMISAGDVPIAEMETTNFTGRIVTDKPKNESSDTTGMSSFIEPAAWRSPTVLLDYSIGIWSGRGVVLDSRTHVTRTIATRFELKIQDDNVLVQRSQISVGKRPGLAVVSSATLDENTALFGEANLQFMLLPGGVSVSCPIRIWPGISFSLELTFLIRPNVRKRILRCYDENCDWIQTVFVRELRVG